MMKNQENYKKTFLLYLLKFAAAFCICYFGTIAVIGLSAGGNYYSKFVDQYFDYISWLRSSLLHGSKWLLSLLGYETWLADRYLLKLKGGGGARIVYSCIGYGVMSFWIAFIFANKGTWLKKIKWILGGLFLIWCINILRICLVLVATNKRWGIPLGFDHHTWFNIVAYILIFVLIYFFDKSNKIKRGNDISLAKTSLSTIAKQ